MGWSFRGALYASVLFSLTVSLLLTDISLAQRGRPGGGRGQGQQASNDTEAERTRIPKEWSEKVDWRSIGPANMMGRITAIAVYEKDPSTWWAASASGGLIKTVNNGVNFEHQFDDQATVSIGDVQVAQSDPNIVWVGTGESNPRNSVSWGDGVYKSTDGGKTWKNMGLQKSYQTGAIAIHPTNPDVVFAGALGRLWGPNEERGLFKTDNGGKTWKKVLYVDDKTGVVDVQLNPKNPDEMLVATYERKRDGFDGNDPVQKYGEGSGIYKSTDGGETFSKVTKGLPTCKLGRIGFDYYRKNPKFIFAVVESEKIAKQPEDAPFAGIRGEDADVGARITNVTDDGPADKAGLKDGDIVVSVEKAIVYSNDEMEREFRKRRAGDTVDIVVSRDRKQVDLKLTFDKVPSTGGRTARSPFTGTLGGQAANYQDQQGAEGFEYGGIYMSSDGGDSWERINTLNPRPMYYSHIRVDPTDRNNVYVCGTSLYRSFDGGKTFKGDGNSDGIHVDNHALWIDGQDSKHMILGCDGGIYVTYDRMEHWQHHNQVALGQFYHVGVGPDLNYKVYGGLQDNGSWGGPSNSKAGGIVNSDWFRVGGGDGFVTLVDPQDKDLIYFESQNGGTGRINLRTGDRGFIRPRPPRGTRYRFNWKTPFLLSPHNSQIYYSAGNHVFRSFNKGDSITAISPEITNTNKGAGSALSESPMEAGVIYVGTTDGAVWMTKDGGQEWSALYSAKEESSGDDDSEPEEEEGSSDEPAKEERAAESEKMEAEEADKATEEEASGETSGEADESSADPISGAWTAKMIFPEGGGGGGGGGRGRGGRAEFTFTLKMGEGNKFTGEMPGRRGGDPQEFAGTFDSKTGAIAWTIENQRGEREYSGTLKDGKIKGEMSGGGGQFQIEFEATRDKQGSSVSLRVLESINPGSLISLISASGFEDIVSGIWTGVIENDDLPGGRIEFSIEMKLDDKNLISGTVESPQGELTIVEGNFSPEKKMLRIVAEGEDETYVEIDGIIENGKFAGEIDVNGGMFQTELTATRKSGPVEESKPQDADKAEKANAKAEAEKAEAEAAMAKAKAAAAQAKASAAKATQTAAPAKQDTDTKKEAAKPADDPVSGEWTGAMISPRGEQDLTLVLKKKADNTVTGSYETANGEGEFTAGKFDPESKKLTLSADNGRFELAYSGEVKENKYAGELDFNAGQFTMEFDVKRTKTPESTSAPQDAKVATSQEKKAGSALEDLLPGPRWVSSIEASRFKAGRCYMSFDGHRSNDDKPYAFVSEDYGKSWKSLTTALPSTAGSVRVLREDLVNQNLLYLGCEFSAWFSVDRGQVWTKFEGLPTVAVHEFATHPIAGEVVAATHGRSLWIADVTILRQMTAKTLSDPATLMKPQTVVNWSSDPGRGDNGPQEFRGQNPSRNAKIAYALGRNARALSLEILDLKGNVVREFEDAETSKGLHVIDWNGSAGGGNNQRFRGGRGGGRIAVGDYLVRLKVDGNTFEEVLTVKNDPESSADRVGADEELEFWLDQFEGTEIDR